MTKEDLISYLEANEDSIDKVEICIDQEVSSNDPEGIKSGDYLEIYCYEGDIFVIVNGCGDRSLDEFSKTDQKTILNKVAKKLKLDY